MSEKSYSVAIIGTGRVAGIKDSKDSTNNFIYTHAKAINCHDSFHLAAVCDSNVEKSKNFAQIWSVPSVANSVQDLLKDSKPDVVVVSSQSDAHFRQVKELLKSSHCPQIIFVEKPICKNKKELKELNEISSLVGVDILVNHTRRFDPVIIECSEIAKSGKLGQLIYVRSDYYGGWINNCTHILDTIMMFSVEELEIIDAHLGANGRGGDYCLDTKLRSASSEIEIISFDESYYQLFEIDFRFSKGRICLRDFGNKISVEEMKINDQGERVLEPLEGFPKEALKTPFYHAYEHIDNHLSGKFNISNTGAELSQTRLLMELLWNCQSIAKK